MLDVSQHTFSESRSRRVHVARLRPAAPFPAAFPSSSHSAPARSGGGKGEVPRLPPVRLRPSWRTARRSATARTRWAARSSALSETRRLEPSWRTPCTGGHRIMILVSELDNAYIRHCLEHLDGTGLHVACQKPFTKQPMQIVTLEGLPLPASRNNKPELRGAIVVVQELLNTRMREHCAPTRCSRSRPRRLGGGACQSATQQRQFRDSPFNECRPHPVAASPACSPRSSSSTCTKSPTASM